MAETRGKLSCSSETTFGACTQLSKTTKTTQWLRFAETSGDGLVQPLPEQGHPEQAAQGWVQSGFGSLQR